MKILHFINSLSAGGAEKLLVDSLILLSSKNIDVDILIINEGPSPFIEKIKNNPNIKLHSLGKNINVYKPIWFFKLNNYFKNYDLVHVHLFPAMYWTAISKKINKKNFKLVFTEHNSTNRRRDSTIF